MGVPHGICSAILFHILREIHFHRAFVSVFASAGVPEAMKEGGVLRYFFHTIAKQEMQDQGGIQETISTVSQNVFDF